MHPAAATATPAPLFLRLLAAIYDALPVLALWFVAIAAVLALSGGRLDMHEPLSRLGVQLLLLALTAAYFIASWLRGGQTIGMRPWRLRVVDAGGGALSARQAALRFVVAIVSGAAAGCGYWWALVDAQRRTWHDLAAGTLMVRLDEMPGSVRP